MTIDLSDKNNTDSVSDGSKPRERILQAALELFVEKGYFNTNVPNISKRSRCSVGSIYHHFANKEEIARQLYVDGIKAFRETLGAAIAEVHTPEQCILSLVTAFLVFAENERLYAQYLWQARHTEFLSGKQDRPTAVGFDRLGRKLARIFKNGMATKEIRELEPELLWNIVFGIPISFVRDWLDGYCSSSPSESAAEIARSCWYAISTKHRS